MKFADDNESSAAFLPPSHTRSQTHTFDLRHRAIYKQRTVIGARDDVNASLAQGRRTALGSQHCSYVRQWRLLLRVLKLCAAFSLPSSLLYAANYGDVEATGIAMVLFRCFVRQSASSLETVLSLRVWTSVIAFRKGSSHIDKEKKVLIIKNTNEMRKF